MLGMFRQLGAPEILVILVLMMLLFGAKRLPEMGRSMGKSLREFKAATRGLAGDVNEGINAEPDQAGKAEASTKTGDDAAGPA